MSVDSRRTKIFHGAYACSKAVLMVTRLWKEIP